MDNPYVRILVELLGISAFCLAAYYNYHPEIHLRNLSKWENIFPLDEKQKEHTKKSMKTSGHISLFVAILISSFLIHDVFTLLTKSK